MSDDWTTTCELLRRTLRNIQRQTSTEWRALVVGHDDPRLTEIDLGKITFCQINAPIPVTKTGMMADKCAKTKLACQQIFQKYAHYEEVAVMLVDPDDLISTRLVEFIDGSNDKYGVFIENGYVHLAGRQWVLAQAKFYRQCGTSFIIRVRRRNEKFFLTPGELSAMLNEGHHVRREIMARRGTPLQPLPFAGAVYTVGTGQNWSGDFFRHKFSRRHWLKTLTSMRVIGARIRREFPGIG